MPALWVPGLHHDPGRSAGYNVGRTRVPKWFKLHDTAGRDSYAICKNGRPGYRAGLCTFLLPKVGPGWQFCEFDALCYDAGEWNQWGPSIEVERLGLYEDLTESQINSLRIILEFGADEWHLPDLQYRGERFDGQSWLGSIAHRDIAYNPDGLTIEEWDIVHASKRPGEVIEPMRFIWGHPWAVPRPIFVVDRDFQTRRQLTPEEWKFWSDVHAYVTGGQVLTPTEYPGIENIPNAG